MPLQPPSHRLLALFLVCAVWATPASADYVWLERSGDGLQARQGKLLPSQGGKTAPAGTLAQPRAVLASGQVLEIERQGEGWTIRPTPAPDVRFSAVEPAAQGVLILHQARFGRNETRAVNDLEFVPLEPGGNTYKLVWKGATVAASEVSVEHAEGWRRSLVPAKDGTVGFTPWMPGLYVLHVSARVNESEVMYEGRKYNDVRHTATLSFEVQKSP